MTRNRNRILLAVLTVLLVCALTAVVLMRFYTSKLQSVPFTQKTEGIFEIEQAAAADEPKQDLRIEPKTELVRELEEKKAEEASTEEQKIPVANNRQALQSPLERPLPSAEISVSDSGLSGNAAQSPSEQNSGTGNNESSMESPRLSVSPEAEKTPQVENTAPASGGMWENELEIDP